MTKGVIDQGWGGEQRVYEVMIFISFIITMIIHYYDFYYYDYWYYNFQYFSDSIPCELLLPTNRP